MTNLASNPLPSIEYLLTALRYENGNLIWNERPQHHFASIQIWKMWNARFANKLAGRKSPSSGYWQVMVDGKRFLNHRVIAKMHNISIAHQIDHIDGDRSNNVISNLRSASQQENAQNNCGWKKRALRVGVHMKRNGRFVAYIRWHGRHKHLGTFSSEEDAVQARICAESSLRKTFAFSQRLSIATTAERGVKLERQ